MLFHDIAVLAKVVAAGIICLALAGVLARFGVVGYRHIRMAYLRPKRVTPDTFVVHLDRVRPSEMKISIVAWNNVSPRDPWAAVPSVQMEFAEDGQTYITSLPIPQRVTPARTLMRFKAIFDRSHWLGVKPYPGRLCSGTVYDPHKAAA